MDVPEQSIICLIAPMGMIILTVFLSGGVARLVSNGKIAGSPIYGASQAKRNNPDLVSRSGLFGGKEREF
jgi:hypothetical protein